MYRVLRKDVWFAVAAVAVAAWMVGRANAESLSDVYMSGHADVGVAYEDGSLLLHLHIHEGGADANGDALSGEFTSSNNVYIGVPDVSKGELNGTTVWTLPGQQEEASDDMPFLGFGAEDLLEDSATWSNITYQLTGISGPGEVLLWNVLMSGTKYYWDSSDGLTEDDVYNLTAGGHGHAYWSFTQEGVYELTIAASGTRDGVLLSDTETFTFLVGDAAIAAVPEPATMGLLISGAFAMAFGLLRRRRG